MHDASFIPMRSTPKIDAHEIPAHAQELAATGRDQLLPRQAGKVACPHRMSVLANLLKEQMHENQYTKSAQKLIGGAPRAEGLPARARSARLC